MAINQIKSIQLQLERSTLTLAHRVENIYTALEELRYLTNTLFNLSAKSSTDIHQWLEQESFIKDDKGYYKSEKSNLLFQQDKLPADSICYHWPSAKSSQPALLQRFFALRKIGQKLKQIKQRLGDVTIIYYQDITQNACLAYPYFDMSSVIPPDFEWDTYHAFESIKQENNPNRVIQWSPPNIDYAGEGLISIASIPVFDGDDCIGLWSIDVPFEAIHGHCVLDTYETSQTNFITDFNGNIISHPSMKAGINKEKGSFYQSKLSSLGKGFADLNLTEMIAKGAGTIDIDEQTGETTILMYQVIPQIDWIMFATLPKENIFEVARDKVTEAFRHMGKVSAAEEINLEVGGGLRELIDGFNEMVKIVAYHQQEREKAQSAALSAQKNLTQKLEKQVAERTLYLQQANAELERLSQVDGLTNVHNRRYLDEHLAKKWREHIRTGSPLSVMLLDIDYFKKYNDTYGHQAGDDCLCQIAQTLQVSLKRPTDILARYGGEEFCVIVNTNRDGAMRVAERLRQSVAALNIEHKTSDKGTVSISIGVNSVVPLQGEAMSQFVEQADQALYKSKEAGRDQVSLFSAVLD